MKRRLMLLGLAALPLAAIAQQGPGMTPPPPPPPGQPGTGPAPAPAMPGWGNATPEQVDWMGRHIAEALRIRPYQKPTFDSWIAAQRQLAVDRHEHWRRVRNAPDPQALADEQAHFAQVLATDLDRVALTRRRMVSHFDQPQRQVIRPVLRSPRRIPGSRLRRLAPARHPVRLQAPAPEPGDPPGNKPRLNFSSKRNRAFFQRNARFSLAMFKQKKVNSVHFSGLINRGYSHDTSTFPLPSSRIRSFVSVIRPIRV